MFKTMFKRRAAKGFTLVELLLVISILGIITAIAVPMFMGQRKRARIIGDAMSNAETIRMALEQRRADNGFYGPPNTYTYKSDGTRPTPDIIPSFTAKGNSKMDYVITIGATSITYTLEVKDPLASNQTLVKADNNTKAEKI